MKQLLLLAYFFPPQPEAGALRPAYLAKYLPDFGWEVTVITRQYGSSLLEPDVMAGRDRKLLPVPQPSNPVVRFLKNVPLAKGSFVALRSIVYFPDAAIGWLPEALKLASAASLERRFNAVLSTSSPLTAHWGASILAKKLALPWVADYRDAWSFNEYSVLGPIRRRLDYLFERHILKRASVLTCVSDGVVEALTKTHGRDGIKVIPNACEISSWLSIPDEKPSAFTLCFAGRLYGGRRNPDMVFAAVRALRQRGDAVGKAIRFEFYGPDSQVASESARRHGLTDAVKVFDLRPRETIMRAQRRSAAQLVLLNMDPRTASDLGVKVLENVGSRRPILATGPPASVVRDFIETAGLGFFASTQDECEAAIREMFSRFSKGHFEPELNRNWRPFTGRDLACEFAKVLDEVARP